MTGTTSLNLVQWPAMVVTVAASWFVTSRYKDNRWLGFLLFLGSNILWTLWGWNSGALALVILQACLAVMNIVGMKRANADSEKPQ